LFLGEGNFSFSANYIKNLQECENLGDIYATCFEEEILERCSSVKLENTQYLSQKGVHVIHGVDATTIHKDPRFQEIRFKKIVFMFPHTGGKMKIHLNRNLLKGIFESCHLLLAPDGLLIITLCKGQGGTPFDPETRRKDDTWKILDISQDSGFVMTHVEKFPVDYFEDYSQVGYRSLQKGFDIQDSVVHLFQYFPAPQFSPLQSSSDLSIKQTLRNLNLESEMPKEHIPVQLYSLTHTHHLSYWYEIPISLEDIREVALKCLGDLVAEVTVVGDYQDNGRTSQTVEIVYKSSKYPLGPAKSFSVHNVLGVSLANIYNVTVR